MDLDVISNYGLLIVSCSMDGTLAYISSNPQVGCSNTSRGSQSKPSPAVKAIQVPPGIRCSSIRRRSIRIVCIHSKYIILGRLSTTTSALLCLKVFPRDKSTHLIGGLDGLWLVKKGESGTQILRVVVP